jgi:hypothetical protein
MSDKMKMQATTDRCPYCDPPRCPHCGRPYNVEWLQQSSWTDWQPNDTTDVICGAWEIHYKRNKDE